MTFDKGDTSFTKAVSDDKNLLSNLKKGVYEVSETLPASDYEFKSAEIAGETNCASKKKEEEKNTLIFAIGYEDLNTPGSRNVTKNLGKALYTNETLSSITMKKIGEKDSEDKDTPLEESFRLYRQGMELLKDLNGRLDTVEKKMLQMNEDGTFREF